MIAPARTPLRIALAGAGRVGTAVALLLKRGGHTVVGVASRTTISAQHSARRLDAPVVNAAGLPDSDMVLIGVHDAAIEDVARTLAPLAPGTIVCHFAGSLGIGVLAPVLQGGVLGVALHPVQACPDVDSAVRNLPGSAWGITASPGLDAWAQQLVARDLNGIPVAVAEDLRPLWHAAAVTTANGIAALLAAGESILTAIGVDSPQRVLTPLAAGAVANAREAGGGAATLTGPVVRGETATIERHIEALHRRAPGLVPSYKLTARLIVQTARHSGRLEPAAADAIAAMVG